jgi:hypothetical protein
MTGALVFAAKSGWIISTSGGKEADPQVLNNRCQEEVTTSMIDPSSEKGGAMLKTAAVSFRDERRRMEWPRRSTPLGGEHGSRACAKGNPFRGSMKAMTEEIELK